MNIFNKKALLSVGTSVVVVSIFFAIAINAQVWDQPQGKQAFGHTHEWPTLLSFPEDCSAGEFVSGINDPNGVLTCATPAVGTDNDWSFAGNDIYRLSDTVSIGSFPAGPALLSALYVKNIAGDNAAQRIETTGNAQGLFINPLSGATGYALWANGRGRFEALNIGNMAGNNAFFDPGMGNLVVENKVGIGTTDPQSKLQVVDGYVQLALSSGVPPAADCDEASEMGRMKVDDSGGGFLYICTQTASGIGWVAK